nr:MAG TPA: NEUROPEPTIDE F F, Moniezia expansa, NPF [Caudoviricetes sp.]DAV39309.1 MAG TPA: NEUROPEPTIDE F F, Moniezia expansa, NPF [Caudoviricetes sp.]DAX53425.1 MAG TPA: NEUROPEPTIDE F F, Moniezia expansa, NPF [Caudoviricetes sp.]
MKEYRTTSFMSFLFSNVKAIQRYLDSQSRYLCILGEK